MSRISRSPDRNTRMSPGLSRRSSPTASTMAATWSGRGPVADLHRKGAAGHLDDGRAPEVVGEPLGLDGGRGDDDLEVRPAGQELGQVAEDEVDVEAALVGLVHDDGVVGRQPAVVAQLGQQDPVGHELDVGGRPHLVGEADRVADGAAHLDAQLGGQTIGHGARRQPTGLGVADHATHPPTQLQADLGQLGGLAGPRLARHHHHLVVTDGLGDLPTPLRHRQVGGIGDGGHAGPTQPDAPGALGRVESPGPGGRCSALPRSAFGRVEVDLLRRAMDRG